MIGRTERVDPSLAILWPVDECALDSPGRQSEVITTIIWGRSKEMGACLTGEAILPAYGHFNIYQQIGKADDRESPH